MDRSLTDDQLIDALQRLAGHLLRAVAAQPRNDKVVQAAFSLPGVGGRGRGMNPVVVANLIRAWAEEIALVDTDETLIDNKHAQHLIVAARAGFSILEPVVAGTVRTLNGAAQRALLIALAEHLVRHILPRLGGLSAVQEVSAWLYDAPRPPPTAQERVNATAVSVMVAAFAAGNDVLGERVLAATASSPHGGDLLASMFGWLVRAAAVVIGEADDYRAPADLNHPRLPDPAVDPALIDAPEGTYDAGREAITNVTSKLPTAVLRERARTVAIMDVPPLTAVVRYVAVAVARNVRDATRQADRAAVARLDPDVNPR